MLPLGDNTFLLFYCELHLYLDCKEQTRKLVLWFFVLNHNSAKTGGIGNHFVHTLGNYFIKKEIRNYVSGHYDEV